MLFSSLWYILSTELAKCQRYFFCSAFKCNTGCFSKFGIKPLEGPWNSGISRAISKSPFQFSQKTNSAISEGCIPVFFSKNMNVSKLFFFFLTIISLKGLVILKKTHRIPPVHRTLCSSAGAKVTRASLRMSCKKDFLCFVELGVLQLRSILHIPALRLPS